MTPSELPNILDPAANAIAMARYIDATREAGAWNAAQEELMAERVESHQRRWEAAWSDAVMIFDEFAKWKRPWWARTVAWALAAWYLLREVS